MSVMEISKEELKKKVESIVSKANLPSKKEEVRLLEQKTYEPMFWQDSKNASELMKKMNALKKQIEDIEMMQLMFEVDDLKGAQTLVNEYEILLFLSAPYDKGDAIFAIHAGQGGTEAMDWADMLFRMYTRYFGKKGWSFEEVDHVPGDEAGIKSTTLNVYGPFAYGYLKAEAGAHRLVRQSPFNAD
ncbi:PCRF domain-containing protein, partial [Candidatus Roizmanbacteria bacterium]|nr:PCRF domain-containing protein [Candidatus Roizmanbacteria bacterium]